MRYFFLILIVLVTCSLAMSQDEKGHLKGFSLNFEYEKECGSPLAESQLYDHREGKVAKIVNGNTLIFEQITNNGNEEKGRFTVQLAGIDSRDNEDKLREFLLKSILSVNIEVFGNTKRDSDKKLFGILWGAGFGDLNRHLLENGMAKFSEPKYFYSVSRYQLCVYQWVVEKAKKEKLGIWANN